MKKFSLQIILFLIPMLLPVLLFVIFDPFMIFGENRGKAGSSSQYDITLNRGFQSTEAFLRNYEDKQYNAYILGNSRSYFFRSESWLKYIDGNCFHFNASAESLFGIEGKLKLLEDKKVEIKHLIMVLDVGLLLQTKNNNDHLFMKHPEVSGESYFTFYKEMFKGFFPKSMFAFSDLFITGVRKPYMSRYGIREHVWALDSLSNQLTYFKYDSVLQVDPEGYYSNKLFPKRDPIEQMSPPVIHEDQIVLLKNINRILQTHHTNYKIVVNPLYDQKKINDADLGHLEQIFGSDHVFDFSGVNEMTTDSTNYYESSHYRPHVANQILDKIYSE